MRTSELAILVTFLSAAPVGAADFVFAPLVASPLPTGQTPIAVRLADLDGDGNLDAVVTGRNWDGDPDTGGRIAIMRGAADGTFTSMGELTIPQGNSEDAAIADLDGDGVLDLVVSVSGRQGRLASFRGHGNGTFDPPSFITLERSPRGLGVADLDGDGDVDVAIVNYNSGSVSIARNDRGTFTPVALQRLMPYLGGIPFPQQVAMADFDGDGDADALVTTIGGGRATLLRGRNDGGLASGIDWRPQPVGTETPAVIGSSLADFDGDGDIDVALPVLLITQSQKVIALGNDGHGGFGAQTVSDAFIFAFAWCSTPIDVDNDGRVDLAVGTAIGGSVSFVRNETTGPGGPITFTPVPIFIEYGFFVRELVTADINHDGRQDVVGIEIAGSTLFTLMNQTQQGGVADAPQKKQSSKPSPKKDTAGGLRKQAPATTWNPLVPQKDMNGDGRVDALDIARWLSDWVPSRAPATQGAKR